mgnify:CR=1 FL=1
MAAPELQQGTLDLLILTTLHSGEMHGWAISRRIQHQSGDVLRVGQGSLYPALYRLEERGWLHGRWVEKAGQRRRRFYAITAEGLRVLARQRQTWKTFVEAIDLITGADHA